MIHWSFRRAMSMLAFVALAIAGAQRAPAQELEPIAYAIRIPAPGMHADRRAGGPCPRPGTRRST